jgi:sRNA-binding protein
MLAQYQHEADPVRKARDLSKLGDEQVEEARKQLKEAKRSLPFRPSRSTATKSGKPCALEAWASRCGEKTRGIQGASDQPAGNHPAHRRTDSHAPVDKRPFFREVRDELAKIQNDLIDALFPRRPNQVPKKANP